MSLIRDTIALVGAGLFLFGVYQWSEPAACIVGGMLLAGVACVWSWLARKEPQ